MRTWAEIDLGALERNYRELRRRLTPGCAYLGVVKANAYGHGALPVAKKLEKLGADYLAVACLEEAVELREGGVKAPILILGGTPPEWAEEVIRCGITQAVYDLPTARSYSDTAQKLGLPMTVHIKTDTGMGRLGFVGESRADDIAAVCALPGLKAEGMFTHFSDADGSAAYTQGQLAQFLALREELAGRGVHFKLCHCAASAATLHYPETHLDMARPGIALYGYDPGPVTDPIPLCPVMTLKTRVAAVRELPAGSAVSYGRTHVLRRDSRLAVLPVGYGDGLDRGLSNRTDVLFAGGRAPILGRICMDLCMADVTDLDVKPGDVATVFGPDISLEEKTDLLGTIPYEPLTHITARVPRVYLDE